MKFFILVSALCVAAYGLSPDEVAQLKASFMKMGEECKNQENASPADINQLIQKKSPTTKEGQCFLACMHKKIGFQNDDGKVNMDGINGWIQKISGMDTDLGGKMRQVADKCQGIVDQSGDHCAIATSIFDCYIKVSNELGIKMVF